MRRHGQSNQRGLTLIEVVTSIVVLGLALPPLISVFTTVAAHGPDDTSQRAAIAYANNLLEEIASKHFEDPGELPGSFGTEEGPRAAYDDVDDYHGLSNSPPQHFDGSALTTYGGFTRSVTVDRVTPLDLDPLTVTLPTGVPTDFKRVRVTVAWTTGRGGEVTLTTLRTDLDQINLSGPLDGPGSAGSAFEENDDELELALVNGIGSDLEVESFSLSASRPIPELEKFRLADDGEKFHDVWEGDAPVPTGTLALNDGKPNERVVPAGGIAGARFEFDDDLDPGPITFTLRLNFTDGSSSTLVIDMFWVGDD